MLNKLMGLVTFFCIAFTVTAQDPEITRPKMPLRKDAFPQDPNWPPQPFIEHKTVIEGQLLINNKVTLTRESLMGVDAQLPAGTKIPKELKGIPASAMDGKLKMPYRFKRPIVLPAGMELLQGTIGSNGVLYTDVRPELYPVSHVLPSGFEIPGTEDVLDQKQALVEVLAGDQKNRAALMASASALQKIADEKAAREKFQRETTEAMNSLEKKLKDRADEDLRQNKAIAGLHSDLTRTLGNVDRLIELQTHTQGTLKGLIRDYEAFKDETRKNHTDLKKEVDDLKQQRQTPPAAPTYPQPQPAPMPAPGHVYHIRPQAGPVWYRCP